MKFTLENGCTVEIKVKNSKGKNDDIIENNFILDLETALIHAATFCIGNGLTDSAKTYFKLYDSMTSEK